MVYDDMRKFFADDRNSKSAFDVTNNKGTKTFRADDLWLTFDEFREYMNFDTNRSLREIMPEGYLKKNVCDDDNDVMEPVE